MEQAMVREGTAAELPRSSILTGDGTMAIGAAPWTLMESYKSLTLNPKP